MSHPSWIGIVVVLGACGGTADRGGTAQIPARGPGVDDTAPVLARAWADSSLPHLVLRTRTVVGDEPDATLYQVVGGALLPNGAFVIADAGQSRLLLYHGNGMLIDTLGRSGRGPGEFISLRGVYSWRDEIVAYDGRLRRLSFWDLTGTMVRDVRLDAGRVDVSFRTLMFVGLFPDGTALVSALGRPASMTGRQRPALHMLQFARNGEFVADRSVHRGDEVYVGHRGDGVVYIVPPFARETLTAVSRDGYYVMDTGMPQFTLYGPDGEAVRTVVSAESPSRVTKKEKARFRGRRFQPALRQVAEPAFEDLPDTKPYAGGLLPAGGRSMLVDESGNLWVRHFAEPTDRIVLWSVFDGDGEPSGMMETPAQLGVMAIRARQVLAVWADSLGVERVGIFDLGGPGLDLLLRHGQQ